MTLSVANIQNQVHRAFAALGDMVQEVSYRYPSSFAQDERYRQQITWTTVTVKALVSQFTRQDYAFPGGLIEAGDKTLYISRKDLDVEISTEGEFIINGTLYSVKDVQSDPAGAFYLVTAGESGPYVEAEPEAEPEA